ncbi:hypothetical protein ASC68_05215 [Devosia sp. Root105]|nr:hypothetical protein ASC68_05215 [Devosia sp. Root105]
MNMMKRFGDMRWVGQMLLIALVWCLSPALAQAQHYPCNGPGPGERLVGMAPNGPGVAPTPLCARDDSGAAPEQPSAPSDGSFAAIAWHVDAADVWVDGNYSGANNIGEQGALDACNRVMGGGCTSGGTWSNSSIAIIRDKEGYFYRGWLGEGGADRDQVMAECSAKQLLPCEVFATIRASTNQRFPGANARKYFAASAWVVGGADDGYNAKLYVASGYRSADAASAAAIEACSADTSLPCETNALTGNGFIQAYRLGGNNDSATTETSARRAKQAAQTNCKKQQSASCDLQALFDSRKAGLFVHDFDTGKTTR